MYNSYSKLLFDLNSENISSIEIIPKRSVVLVSYKNGQKASIPIFYSDQNVIKAARETNTPIYVNDYRNEIAYANLISYLGLLSILMIGLTFLIKRVSKLLDSAISMNGRRNVQVPEENLNVRFEDIAGLKEAKEELKEIVTFIKNPSLLEKLGAKRPKGILIGGPPGTGKTLLARALACEAEVPFYSVSASEFVELFVGIGSLRIRNLFAKARENSPSIIFIDEIDGIARQRGFGLGIGNDEQEQTLNQLLTEMDGFDSDSKLLVLAATNRIEVLDPAIKRAGRFDRTILLSLPDSKERLDSLGIHSRCIPLAKEVSLKELADKTTGFSGADLQNLLNESAIIAATTDAKEVNPSHIENAYNRICNGINSKLVNDQSKLLVAYREASKALVAYLTSHPEKIDKLSILSNNKGQKGYTRFLPTEENIDYEINTKSFLISKIKLYLAPRAVEMLIYGRNEITQLSEGDLSKVEKTARSMIEQYGFSKSGYVYIEKKRINSFLGKSFFRQKRVYSEKTINNIDQEVIKLAKNSLNDCIELLSNNRDKLESIVELLINEETINSNQLYLILNDYKIDGTQPYETK